MAEEMIETWVDIPGFPNYMASSLGRIKSIKKLVYNAKAKRLCWKKERILSINPAKNGYVSLSIIGPTEKKNWLAHRLICAAFHPNPENKHFVNHKNGIKWDNRPENLEWVTRSENVIHAVDTGLHTALRGSTNGNSKLTEDQVLQIRAMEGNSFDIAKHFGIGRTTVLYIKNGKLWKHI